MSTNQKQSIEACLDHSRVHTVVLYHADCLDGFGAAYVAWRKLGQVGVWYKPVKYQTFPPLNDCENKHVYVLDFCYPTADIRELCKVAKSVTIIDHHETAEGWIDALWNDKNQPPENLTTYFDKSCSGAMLTWEHFFSSIEDFPSNLISAISDRDLWTFALDGTKEITTVLANLAKDFEQWRMFEANVQMEDTRDWIIREGTCLLSAWNNQVEKIVADSWEDRTFESCPCRMVNCHPMYASDVGNKLAEASEHGVGITFYVTKKKIKYSVRVAKKSTFNAAKFASIFGGGGHEKAAGFETDL